MKYFKIVLVLIFFVLLAGRYLNLFPDYDITEKVSLFELRHAIVLIYFLILWREKNNKKHEEA